MQLYMTAYDCQLVKNVENITIFTNSIIHFMNPLN